MFDSLFCFVWNLRPVFTSLILSLLVMFAQQPIQMTTKLETHPDRLIGEEYLFLVTEEKANLKLIKEPVYQSTNPRYKKALIGNSPEMETVAVVVDEAEGKAPRVYVDANNNGDSTDDANSASIVIWTGRWTAPGCRARPLGEQSRSTSQESRT